MKKFLEKSYSCLIFAFFSLYLLLIRTEAKNNPTSYAICLLIGAIVLIIIPFFTNSCKKIEVRRTYLITNVAIGAFVILQAIDYLILPSLHKGIDTYSIIRRFVISIASAVVITSAIFMLFYVVKDFFKKGYSIQKFDLHAISMFFSILSSIFILIIVFILNAPGFEQHLDNAYNVASCSYIFDDGYLSIKGILIVLLS
ncbi:MAG: hypothetical protein SOU19_00550, partial [Candidatus Caccosoma sp.]|nr:hypothetical protein [Candidatus Caccosoma sp.]